MSRHIIDALLRPPVELWTAFIAVLVALILVLGEQQFVAPAVSRPVACLVLLLAVVRVRQALRVVRYRRRVRRLRTYRLSAAMLPTSRLNLFLGLGFRWRQRHIQRLRDTQRPELEHYLRQGRLYRLARTLEQRWETARSLSSIVDWLRAGPFNPFKARPDIGGNPALHGVGIKESKVWMPIYDRVGHTLVLGTTRVGKTRLAELLIAQDIRRGDVVIVIDPKGDADLLRRVWAEAARAGREDQLTIFHLGFPKVSARYNAIGRYSRITEVATRIANQLPSSGNSAAFKEFAWRFVNIIARALVALGEQPNFERIRRYINDIEPLFLRYGHHYLQQCQIEDWQEKVQEKRAAQSSRSIPHEMRGRQAEAIALYQFLQERRLQDSVLEGLASTFKYDRNYFDKIVSSVGPLLEKLCSGAVAPLLSPASGGDDQRPVLDWLDTVRQKGIVYVGLDALSDTTVAGAVGNAMFADLVSVAGHLYKHGLDGASDMPTISLHADEFNELIGDEFVPLLNKAGGAGFQVTAYTQTWSDVEARLGDRAKAGQVAGNFNSMIMMRVKDPATAEMLTRQLPTVDVLTLMSVSAVDDSSDPSTGVDFQSRNEDRISVSETELLSVADLVALPKGQAFALLNGGQLFKLRIPLLEAPAPRFRNPLVDTMAALMARHYTTAEAWSQQERQWWIAPPT